MVCCGEAQWLDDAPLDANTARYALGGTALAEARLLCVLVPHFKDEYWLSVANGIETRAALRGLHVRFFEAGGYRALQGQIAQLDSCQALQPGAILIGAVSSDDPALLAAVADALAGEE